MSSWFGESLSNLKGQLQNFTKEVLSEAGETEVADEAVSLRVKCEELQSVCDTQALEISALRKQNNELQRRLQGDSSKTASPAEQDDGSSWWSVEQRWDASYFGGSSSSSAAGKQDRKGRGQHVDEKEFRVQELREKLAVLERLRNEAEGCKEENGRLSASVRELTERLQRDSGERRVLEDKLRDATAKVLELEGELQKVQKQFLETLGDSQRRVVETEVDKLQTEKRRLSSELGHAVESLGDPERQEVIHGTLQALELENQVLKIRNAQLELAAKASSKGGEAGWDTLDDHDSRGRSRTSVTSAPAHYEDDFDTLSLRSEVSESSLHQRKQLEVQLAALQEQVERSEQLKKTWADQKVELEEKLVHMQQKIEDAETREAEIRTRVAEDEKCLSLEVEAMSKVIQDLETQLASLKEENVGLCSSLEELDSQHQGALDQLLTVKDALANDNEQLRLDAETLRTRMLDLTEEKTKDTMDAPQLAEAVARAFEGLRWRKDTLERKVVELSRERAGMATELDNLRGVLPPIPEEGEAEAWLLVAKDGMESLEGELERTKAALEALREDKKQSEELDKCLEALQGELDRAKAANADADGALELLRSKNVALEAQVAELSSERVCLESLRLELDCAKAAKSETEKALEDEVERLRVQLGSIELELDKAMTAKSETEKALEDEVERLRGQLGSIQLELEQSRTTESETEKALEDEVERLRRHLGSIELELDKVTAAKSETEKALEAEVERLRGQLGSIHLELQQARTTKSETEKALDDYVERLRRQQSSIELELDKAVASKNETEAELRQLRGEVGRLGSIDLELEQTRAAKSESEEALRRLTEKNAALEAQVEDLQSEQSRQKSLELELERSRTANSEAEKRLEDLKAQNAALEAQADDLLGRVELDRVGVAALDDLRGELGGLALELTQVRAAKSDSEKALGDLGEKNAALEAQMEGLRGLQQSLEAELEACRQESAQAKEEVKARIDGAASTEEKVREAQAAQRRAEEEMDRLRAVAARVEFLQLELEWTKSLIEKQGSETPKEDVEEKKEDEVRQLELAVENLREKNSVLETEIGELRTQSARMEALLADRRGHMVQDVERLMMEKLNDLEEKNEALERRLRAKEEALGEQKSPLSELDYEAALEEARKSVADLEEQSAMGKETVTRLSEVVRDKDAELERLRLERDELVRTVHLKHQESLQYHALLTQNIQQQQQLHHEDAPSPAAEEECARLAGENRILNNELQERATKESALQKELERLRQHMVSVEDAYTQETLRAEERAAQLLKRLAEAEEMLKSSSTAHTSANILANQQVEALRVQAKVTASQRDDARARLGDAEEQAHKQLVALRNLQSVLDKFQRDKDKDVLEETAKVRKHLQLSEERRRQLEGDLAHVRDQLAEAKEGLKAAARLGEQLEAKDELVRTLKARVTEIEGEVKKVKEEAAEHLHGAGSKVDRDLVKNLVVGFFSAPPANRTPVLRVLADVLELSAAEGHQLGLTRGGGTSAPSPSLSEAFVRFLESESQPQRQLRLLPSPSPSPTPRRATTAAAAPPTSSSSLLQPTPAGAATPPPLLALPTLATHFSAARNTGAILKDVLKDS